MEKKEKTKVIKINGMKTTIVVPPKLKLKDIPDELKSEKNKPKGSFLTL